MCEALHTFDGKPTQLTNEIRDQIFTDPLHTYGATKPNEKYPRGRFKAQENLTQALVRLQNDGFIKNNKRTVNKEQESLYTLTPKGATTLKLVKIELELTRAYVELDHLEARLDDSLNDSSKFLEECRDLGRQLKSVEPSELSSSDRGRLEEVQGSLIEQAERSKSLESDLKRLAEIKHRAKSLEDELIAIELDLLIEGA